MSSSKQATKPGIPNHVGIVMDGNGRWAKSQDKVRLEGHKKGADVARQVVRWAQKLGIRHISLYAFSTENWDRPKLEVRALMGLLAMMLPKTLPEMKENGVRFRVLGDISPLPAKARKAVEQACAETCDNSSIDLILCLNYGGQQEIVAGVQQTVKWLESQSDSEKALAELTPETFRSMLWRHDMAPVDLLIRTGGEHRISNFHLWDAAYAELYFSDLFWPDFTENDLQMAVEDYAARERRFGKTSEQVRR